MQTWIEAFILTNLIEIPIYCFLLKEGPYWRRAIIGFSATAMTHPIIWFVFYPRSIDWGIGYVYFAVVAEVYAVGVEGFFLKTLGFQHPWRIALIANAVSFAVGLLIF